MSMPRYPEYKDSGVEWLRSIPSHWEVMPGRRLFDEMREPARLDDEQLSATQRYGVIPQRKFMEAEDQKVVLALAGTASFKHVQKDDFVISLRSFQGGIEHSNYHGCVSPAYTVLRPRIEVVPRYFAYTLKSSSYISALQTVTAGIREGKSISFAQFGSLELPLPSLEEQYAISIMLDRETAKIDALMAEQEKLLALLAEKRQATISHAVTRGVDPNVPMKDSGIPWLGEVPAHWEVKRIKHAVANCGYKAGPFGSSLITSELRDDGEILVLSPENVARATLDLPTNQFLPADRALEMAQFFVDKRDVVFPIVGSLGRALVINAERPGILNQRLAKITPDEGVITSEYLKLLMTEVEFYKKLDESESKGAIISHITKESLLNRPVVLPPIVEQIEILGRLSEKLGEFEDVCLAIGAAIELMRERRSALISAAVTGQIDVRGLVEADAA